MSTKTSAAMFSTSSGPLLTEVGRSNCAGRIIADELPACAVLTWTRPADWRGTQHKAQGEPGGSPCALCVDRPVVLVGSPFGTRARWRVPGGDSRTSVFFWTLMLPLPLRVQPVLELPRGSFIVLGPVEGEPNRATPLQKNQFAAPPPCCSCCVGVVTSCFYCVGSAFLFLLCER